ncbi:Sulfite exporter TauE/SafE family protein 3 [Glycine soja]
MAVLTRLGKKKKKKKKHTTMAMNGSPRRWDVRLVLTFSLLLISASVSALEHVNHKKIDPTTAETSFLGKVMNFLWSSSGSGYEHTWPEIEFGWRIITGTIIGFVGSAFGTVGGVGGGGIFVTMLSLIIGFDAKSATAISKCMITGGAAATVFYNLRQKHPTLDMPVIDYDLALLFQPVLVLGISIGVAFNETARQSQFNGTERTAEVAYEPLPGGPNTSNHKEPKKSKETGSILENVRWKALGVLFTVWVLILASEIAKSHTTTCSVEYWVLNLLQVHEFASSKSHNVPVALGATSYQAVLLYTGKRVIASKGDQRTQWRAHQLIMYCSCGICAGIVGGLLGLGGGFILGPLFLELGIPPQVSSATATFAMTFSASMSVVEYYLLKRFPIPYTLYFVAVSTFAAFVGQVLVRKLVAILGRASLIIFILSSTIFVSGVGISNMIQRIANKEYMGFENLCTYSA